MYLFGAKLLSDLVLAFRKSNTQEQFSVNLESKYTIFHTEI